MRLACLGSGSRGNAALVEYRDTLLMVDCGFSVAETERRLARAGRDPADITALLVTHEHSDHAAGALRFAARHDIPVYLTPGTGWAIGAAAHARTHALRADLPLRLGAIEVHPLAVPHDAREPCQFVFEADGLRLGMLTDTGHPTPYLLACLADCDAMVIECNHDAELLAAGSYPPALKRRVGGPFGHLSNAQAASVVAARDTARLQWLAGVHLSEQNNTPERAGQALSEALGSAAAAVHLATQDEGLDWLELVR